MSPTPGTYRTPTAKELGELLPQWTRGEPLGPSDYMRLKAAALALARAPEQERQNVITAYGWAYCEMSLPDAGRASGMFLLLRVLFVVPEGGAVSATHVLDGGRILIVRPCCGNRQFSAGDYNPLFEYDTFAERFRRRSPAEIEALEIK